MAMSCLDQYPPVDLFSSWADPPTTREPHTESSSHVSLDYRSSAKYLTTLIIAPANISVLNHVIPWFIVPLIAVERFSCISPMYWTLQNLSENKQ
jgi:hypothetical protein